MHSILLLQLQMIYYHFDTRAKTTSYTHAIYIVWLYVLDRSNALVV